MHKKLLTWFWMLVFTGFVSYTAQSQTADRPEGVIKVAKVSGQVTATKDGNSIDLSTGTEISQGYVVNTGADASVVLVFSNGATINLAEDSSLSIDEFLQDPFAEELSVASMTAEPSVSTTKLHLSRGELVGNVKKLNADAGSTFTVQTPVGAAGIRGTTFRIIFRPDGTGRAFFSLTTVEGNVVLSSGTVNMPSEVAVADNKEIEIVIDVDVDDATGVITVSSGPDTPVIVIDTPPATQAALAATVQQVAQAIATVVFTAPSATTPPSTTPTPTTTPEKKTEETPTQSPPATQTTPRTTSGDGK
jgi:hypothetical protein